MRLLKISAAHTIPSISACRCDHLCHIKCPNLEHPPLQSSVHIALFSEPFVENGRNQRIPPTPNNPHPQLPPPSPPLQGSLPKKPINLPLHPSPSLHPLHQEHLVRPMDLPLRPNPTLTLPLPHPRMHGCPLRHSDHPLRRRRYIPRHVRQHAR